MGHLPLDGVKRLSDKGSVHQLLTGCCDSSLNWIMAFIFAG
jgi:hypothetical protein